MTAASGVVGSQQDYWFSRKANDVVVFASMTDARRSRKLAAMFSRSAKAKPSSGPRTINAVAIASAKAAFSLTTVTDAS